MTETGSKQGETGPGERTRRLEEILTGLDAGARRERLAIACELHDRSLQSLSSAVLRLRLVQSRQEPEQAQEDLERAESLIRDAVEQLRRLSNDLRVRSGALDDLPAALRALADHARATLQMDPELELDTERRPADLGLTEPLMDALRALLLEVRLRGGRAVALRYATGTAGDLCIEARSAEIGEAEADVALERLLGPARDSLRTFDVSVERRPGTVRFLVPASLVEEDPLRRDPARSRSE